MCKTQKYARTHPHTQLLLNSKRLGRCVTHVRPLLTPSVAQQGVFVWYPRTTVREGGGGWCREAGLQPHFLLGFVCMSNCSVRVCVCACRACRWAYAWWHCATMFVYSCVCVCVCIHACVCVCQQGVESVVVCSLTVTDKYTLTTRVKKLNALFALFSPWRLPFSASLNFSPPIFIFYIFLSLSYSPAFALSLLLFSFAPPSLHLWWF